MANYTAPTLNAIFDSKDFKDETNILNQAQSDARYVRYPSESRTETLQATTVNGNTTLIGQTTATKRVQQILNSGSTWEDVNGYYALDNEKAPAVNPLSVGNLAVSVWNTRVSADDLDWTSVCWSPQLTRFVAVSNNGGATGIMTSTDGITWTSVSQPAPTYYWRRVTWSPERSLFVAVTSSGTTDRVMTSSTGTSGWTLQTTPNASLFDICWSKELGLFCAAGSSQMLTSPNGTTWTSQTNGVPARSYTGICWSPELSLFVAICQSGTNNRVLTSPNGTTWTTRTTPSPDSALMQICWSPEQSLFVAIAAAATVNSTVMTSPDGINWTYRTVPNALNFQSVKWAAELGLFCAVASSGTISQQIITSPNGINWTSRTAAANNILNGLVWSPELGIFVSVAASGTGNRVQTSNLAGRPPTSYNVFNSLFNNINENNTSWLLRAKNLTTNDSVMNISATSDINLNNTSGTDVILNNHSVTPTGFQFPSTFITPSIDQLGYSVSIGSTAVSNITSGVNFTQSVSLTAGVWIINMISSVDASGTLTTPPVISEMSVSINNSATIDSSFYERWHLGTSSVAGFQMNSTALQQRISTMRVIELSATTTIFYVFNAIFTLGTATTLRSSLLGIATRIA